MVKKDNSNWKSAIKTVGQVSQIGFTFAFSVLISVGIGYWLDNYVGTDPLFKLVFLVLGLLSGGWSVYKTLSGLIEKDE
ncbi:AtpZ/AtpI family protein [Candidatus Bipolaricaulota bacterium]|nr:AtpZ/AtpI family protein [Candidatus Bipolaricaulota bacterium]